MAQLIDIQQVVIGPRDLIATVRIADGAPLMTSEDVEATAHVYWLMPEIANHACLGDAGTTFQDAMGDTELAHLLEHVTLELLAQTNMAGDMSHGRTAPTDVDRTYTVTLACPDDVLVAGALSSAAWILQWAYSGANPDTEPNVPAIVQGLVDLTQAAFASPEDDAETSEDAAIEPVDEAEIDTVAELDEAAQDQEAPQMPEAPQAPEVPQPAEVVEAQAEAVPSATETAEMVIDRAPAATQDPQDMD
ncbi:hypothetical protein AAK684_05965 [Leptogranulimonas caecicola]|uniref:Cyanophycin synthase-like N-terminal domain-containing protein n=1 Tax=Leptogranulimonas caecicola TaxID=2894156 RepID=A0AAU9CGV6_9ACTN|nr:hypothetical protein [Leptogranulimonas caecicola]BCV19542.1 hypothetical protein ATOBIA_N00770 [Atopobiaceae bacterium P1]BDC90206.1 hypothetical protein ATTO_00780 [Leptogranulimonas caecicola]